MSNDDLAPGERFEIEAEGAREPVPADYCAACGVKAPTRPETAQGRLFDLQGLGWLCLPSRSLHPDRVAAVPHNCLCPACLAAPNGFTLRLLRAWGWPVGPPDVEPRESRRASWPQSST